MSKKAVFVVKNSYSPELYELLRERFNVTSWESKDILPRSELIENIKGKFGIICSPSCSTIDKEVIQAAGKELKVVSTHSVGCEHLDIKELKSRGIRIGHLGDVLTEPVAEHAIAILLSISRRVLEGHNCVLRGEWGENYMNPSWICGNSLNSSTVSIVGCGRIGLSIMRKIKPFSPRKIFYYNRSNKVEADELGAELKSLDCVMKESDFVILALPHSGETKGIINKKRISFMRSNAILVNIGRGALIDENALIEALQTRSIGGAALDVFNEEPLPLDSPLLKLSNVVLTPHIGSCTRESVAAAGRIAALNVIAVLDNEKMPSEL